MNTNTGVNSTAAQNNASETIPGTDWTYADAASMAKECARDARLFGQRKPSPRRTSSTSVTRSARFMAKFFQETGWTWADAVSEAIACRRENRLSAAY